MSVRTLMVAALMLTACAEPQKPVKDPRPLDEPFPDEGPHTTGPPLSGSCYADLDCKGNGMTCLNEGKGKGPGTCVRMDPSPGPNALPTGPRLF